MIAILFKRICGFFTATFHVFLILYINFNSVYSLLDSEGDIYFNPFPLVAISCGYGWKQLLNREDKKLMSRTI